MSTQFTNRQWRLPNEENKSKVSNYSMDFDGVNGTGVTTGSLTDLGISDTFSFSLWVKLETVQRYKHILANSHFGNGFALLVKSVGGNLVWAFHVNGWNSNFINDTSAIVANQWYHIAVSWNNTTGAKMYINNGSSITGLSGTTLGNLSTNIVIGASSSVQYAPIGQIDGVAIFNYELSSSQVTTLYGSSSTGIGNPMSLSPKPVAFYQIGDKSAFNGANYLVPNIAAEEADGDIAASYSPYALEFDSASSDYIDCGSFTALNSGTAMTVSLWFKGSTYITNARLIRCAQFEIYQSTATASNTQGRLYYKPRTSYGNPIVTLGGTSASGVGNMVDGNWHHICLTFDNSTTTTIAYEDGISVISNTTTGGTLNQTATNLWISSGGATLYNSGSISNVSVWNTALTSAQVTEIYNEGVPSNLNNHSAYSNLVSWWQLGSNSSFNTNWTVLDEVTASGNNGTSSNMGEDAIVDGVNSYANGVSSGMSDNIVGSAPFSDANSLSYNMDVLDRLTDVPN